MSPSPIYTKYRNAIEQAIYHGGMLIDLPDRVISRPSEWSFDFTQVKQVLVGLYRDSKRTNFIWDDARKQAVEDLFVYVIGQFHGCDFDRDDKETVIRALCLWSWLLTERSVTSTEDRVKALDYLLSVASELAEGGGTVG